MQFPLFDKGLTPHPNHVDVSEILLKLVVGSFLQLHLRKIIVIYLQIIKDMGETFSEFLPPTDNTANPEAISKKN